MNEISRWINLLQKQIWIPPSFLLKPAPTDLYAEIRVEDTTKIINNKDFMDFTIYRDEIQENIKEIWRFTRISRISLIYTKHTKMTINPMHSTYRLLITENLVHQTNTGHRCPLKRGNTQLALYLAHNIYIYIYWRLQKQFSRF